MVKQLQAINQYQEIKEGISKPIELAQHNMFTPMFDIRLNIETDLREQNKKNI